jgi:predicted nucleic acid-binding protein
MLDAVVDAAVVVAVLARRDALDRLRTLVGEGELCAPDLVDLEVIQTLRRMVHRGDLPADEGATSVAALAELPVDRVPCRDLGRRIWELRSNLTAYDAAYVALAEREGLPLLSHDGRLSRAPGVDVPVISL